MEVPRVEHNKEGYSQLIFSNGKVISKPLPMYTEDIAKDQLSFFRIGGKNISLEKAKEYTHEYLALVHEELKQAYLFCTQAPRVRGRKGYTLRFNSNFCDLVLIIKYSSKRKRKTMMLDLIKLAPMYWGI